MKLHFSFCCLSGIMFWMYSWDNQISWINLISLKLPAPLWADIYWLQLGIPPKRTYVSLLHQCFILFIQFKFLIRSDEFTSLSYPNLLIFWHFHHYHQIIHLWQYFSLIISWLDGSKFMISWFLTPSSSLKTSNSIKTLLMLISSFVPLPLFLE